MDIIVIALLWFFIVPFVGIRLVFFGGFGSHQRRLDEDYYWEKEEKRKPIVDSIVGFAFLFFYAVFMYLTFWPITTMFWPEISPIISSLWS